MARKPVVGRHCGGDILRKYNKNCMIKVAENVTNKQEL